MYVTDATFAVAKRKRENKIQAYKELIEQPAPIWLVSSISKSAALVSQRSRV